MDKLCTTKHIKKKRHSGTRKRQTEKWCSDWNPCFRDGRNNLYGPRRFKSPAAAKQVKKKIDFPDDRTTRSASEKSQRWYPAVVVARGEPLTASTNSTPFPPVVHHHLYVHPYHLNSHPLSSKHPFLNDRRRKRHNPVHPPLRGGFETTVSVVLPTRDAVSLLLLPKTKPTGSFPTFDSFIKTFSRPWVII